RILRAALAFADEHGVAALRMRELGRELGYEAMALYRHVANKDEIVDGILDLVLEETVLPEGDGDWRDAIRRSAVSVHEALDRHPWATHLLASSARLRPRRLAYMEALLARLDAAGLSDEATYHAYHVLNGYIFGFALWQSEHASAELTPELVQRV